MCGILYYSGRKIDRNQFEAAAKEMNHRGPDNTGFYFDADQSFAHNRLSIIDVSERSHQPFELEDYVLIFNGEIYNYKELIIDHQLQINTKSDTEVLLRMFMKYKENCLQYFNGMFAFVLYNKRNKEVFIARDRLGIKPLYIYNSGSETIVASEISAIHKMVSLEVDEFGLRQYKKLRMTVNNDTVYKNVKFFPAGSYLYNNKVFKYWSLPVEEKEAPEDEELKILIDDAVNLRMRSDVPVSSYLSGGLDSTIITALARPNASWTIGFDSLNEFKWSKIAGDEIGVDCHQISVDYDSFQTAAKELVKHRKEPLSVPNEVLIYLMTLEARKLGYKVILSGEGADELFWGYDRIFRWAKDQKQLTVEGFDAKYCYGTHSDNEVVDYALSITPEGTPLQKVAYYFQIVHLQGLLRRVDNSTMMCSVEGRIPFVDHRLVEFMNGRPFEYKMGNSFKEPLKRIYKNIIPRIVVERSKMGFPVPLNEIYNTADLPSGWDEWFTFNLNNFNL